MTIAGGTEAKTPRQIASAIIDAHVDHFHGGLGEAIAEAIENARRAAIEECAAACDAYRDALEANGGVPHLSIVAAGETGRRIRALVDAKVRR